VALTRLALLAACAGLVTAPAEAGPLEALERWLAGTETLEARFRQVLVSHALGAGAEEAGRLYLERPGRMRWDYLEPERKVAIVEGERARLYVEADAQLWEGALEPSERALPALLSSERSLADLFETREAGADRVVLLPRTQDEAYEELTIAVDPRDGAVQSVEVLDAAGNRMRYEFSGLRRNAGVPPEIFEFEPPPGTEVVARP
jgi:outer membrane lipoprotein carrier protein